MNILKRALDAKTSFEGKFLAVFVSVALILSGWSLSAFADGNSEQETIPSQSEKAKTSATTGNVTLGAAFGARSDADADADTAKDSVVSNANATKDQQNGTASEANPDDSFGEVPTVAADEALVSFSIANAYVLVNGQALLSNTLNVLLHKELKFNVNPETGFAVESVKAKNKNTGAEIGVREADGAYSIAAENVDSNLLVEVKTKAVDRETTPDVTADPITKDTAIENNAAFKPSDAAANGATLLMSEMPSALDPVKVKLVYADEFGNPTDKTEDVEISGGVIAANAPARAGYDFVEARVDNGPVVFAGTINGVVYYTVGAEELSGVAMQLGNKTIELYYQPHVVKRAVAYKITGNGAGKAGNEVEGVETVADGGDLNVGVKIAYGFKAELKVNGEAQPVIDGKDVKYVINDVKTDTEVTVEFARIDTVNFKVANPNMATWHEAIWSDLDKDHSVPTANIDSDEGIDFAIEFTSSPSIYTYYKNPVTGEVHTYTGSADGWRLNSFRVNGENLPTPRAFEVGSKSTAKLASGVQVTIELIEVIQKGEGKNACKQFKHKVTFAGVKENIIVDSGNLRAAFHNEIMPEFDAGVKNLLNLASGAYCENYIPLDYKNGPWKFAIELNKGYTIQQVLLDGEKIEATPRADGSFEVITPRNTSLVFQRLKIETSLTQYKVAYDANEGVGAPSDSSAYSIADNSSVLLNSKLPTKAGEFFVGWMIGDKTYQPGSLVDLSELIGSADADNVITFKAQWTKTPSKETPIPVQVNYYKETNSGSYEHYKTGTVMGYRDSELVKWNAEDELASLGKYFEFNEGESTTHITVDGVTSIDLYYSLAPLHKVEYAWAGEVPSGELYDEDGKKVDAPVLPGAIDNLVKGDTYEIDTALPGTVVFTHDAYGNQTGKYTLGAWDDKNNGVMGTNDVIITGTWKHEPIEVQKWKVTYKYEGNVPENAPALPVEKEYVKNQLVTVEDVLSCEGYKFDGWSKSGTFNMPAESVTIVGTWEADFSGFTAKGFETEYDGNTHGIQVDGKQLPGDVIEYWVGNVKLDANEFVNVADSAEVTVKIIRGGETFELPSVKASIKPAKVTIEVDDASKVAGTDDPSFTGKVSGLVHPSDLGEVVFGRTNADENGVGTYEGVLSANYEPNGNYEITIIPGTFTIVAAPVVPPTPTTPTTPPTAQEPTPLNPPAPAPTPEPVAPTPDPVAPVVNAIEQAIAPVATPLAGPNEQTIADDETPLAGFDVVNCWVHYYIIIGIIITMLYGAGVLVRRISFTRKLKGWEKDVLGEDETVAAPVAPAMPAVSVAPAGFGAFAESDVSVAPAASAVSAASAVEPATTEGKAM